MNCKFSLDQFVSASKGMVFRLTTCILVNGFINYILIINLSLVSNFKGRATIVARHVNPKVRSESILYLRSVLINQR